MSHPNAIELEAFACGERKMPVVHHVAQCSECRGFVAKIERANADGPLLDVSAAIERADVGKQGHGQALERGANRDAQPRPRSRWSRFATAAWTAPLLAAAAAAVLWLRMPTEVDRSTARPPFDAPKAPAFVPGEPRGSATQFKGGAQLAAVRERDGRQERFTTTMPVRPGDRFRLEVALDGEQDILAAVIGDDGQRIDLLPLARRGAGVHFSEEAVRIDTARTEGFVVVGTKAEVERAHAEMHPTGLPSLRIRWVP